MLPKRAGSENPGAAVPVDTHSCRLQSRSGYEDLHVPYLRLYLR